MHESFSGSGLGLSYLGYASLGVYARGSSAISSEARLAKDAATVVVFLAEQSKALFGEKASAISQLMALYDECSEPGWDGHEASALDPVALRLAVAIVRSLPDDIPLPEFAPEPDGSVSLDWIQSRYRLFSLSVGTSHRLAYAWVDGADKGHAVARFDEVRIPPMVLEGIRGITNYGKTLIAR